MTAATLRPPEVAGMGRGLTLALIAHGLLILALSYGLNWHSDSSPAFEAELWSSIPQVAAPREEASPEPEPEAPKPDTRAQQRAAEEAAAEQQREADIAIAKEKRRKEKEKEERAREEAAQLEREKAIKEKEAKDKAAKEKAAKEEQERAKKEKAAKDAKEAKEAKDADAKREAQRQEFLRRIQGMAGGTPNSTGNAAQNSGPSGSWISRVRTILSNSAKFPDGDTIPMVEIRVFLAPDGRILGRKVMKPSADPAWDEAALRGIDKVGQLPRDGDKRLPEYLDLPMCPRTEAICAR